MAVSSEMDLSVIADNGDTGGGQNRCNCFSKSPATGLVILHVSSKLG